MNVVTGTRICAKSGECYKVLGIDRGIISLTNVKNGTIIAYKEEDLELFLPVFSNDDLTCLF
ncbi:MAG: hypothetical protein ACAF41_12450 [Leptolyngbya sp. BL-A-14]